MRKKKISRLHHLLPACLLAGALLFAFTPVSAAAKTVTVKEKAFSTEKASVHKAAKTVKKGTVTVKVKKNGYLKFTAPKTANYKFTYTNLKSLPAVARDVNNGHAYVMVNSTYSNKTITMGKISTKGGSASTICLASKYAYNLNKSSITSITSGTYLPTRTAKIKLKKGQTVYLYFYLSKPGSLKLTVK